MNIIGTLGNQKQKCLVSLKNQGSKWNEGKIKFLENRFCFYVLLQN